MKNAYRVFGSNVRKRRKQLGLTQEQLAIKVSQDPRDIRAIESGNRNVTIKTLYKLCKALQTTASKLLAF